MSRLTVGYYLAVAAVWCIVSSIEDLRDDMHMRTSLLRDERIPREVGAREDNNDGTD